MKTGERSHERYTKPRPRVHALLRGTEDDPHMIEMEFNPDAATDGGNDQPVDTDTEREYP